MLRMLNIYFQELDYDAPSDIHNVDLSIQVYEATSTSSYSANTRILLEVKDVNDNAPVFEPAFMEFDLEEDISIDRSITTFEATDIDTDLNGEFK